MNNKQHIEGFILQYRPEFDTVTPQECLWPNVSTALDRLKHGDALEHFVAVQRPVLDMEWPDMKIWHRIDAELNRLTPPAQHHHDDALEAFIQQNRADFDSEVPDLRIWNELSNQTSVAPKVTTMPLRVSWYQRMSRVAAAVALLIVGAALGLWYANYQQEEAYVGMKMSEVSQEYAALEARYERDIKEKKNQLARFASNPGASEVFGDMEQMDKVMEELRIELSNVPPGNREQIIRVMIENYKSKTMVLEKILEAMQAQQGGYTEPGDYKQTNNNDQDTI
jgi:hypothetical protein